MKTYNSLSSQHPFLVSIFGIYISNLGARRCQWISGIIYFRSVNSVVPSQLGGGGWKPVLFVENADDVPDFYLWWGRGVGAKEWGLAHSFKKRSTFSTNSIFLYILTLHKQISSTAPWDIIFVVLNFKFKMSLKSLKSHFYLAKKITQNSINCCMYSNLVFKRGNLLNIT